MLLLNNVATSPAIPKTTRRVDFIVAVVVVFEVSKRCCRRDDTDDDMCCCDCCSICIDIATVFVTDVLNREMRRQITTTE